MLEIELMLLLIVSASIMCDEELLMRMAGEAVIQYVSVDNVAVLYGRIIERRDTPFSHFLYDKSVPSKFIASIIHHRKLTPNPPSLLQKSVPH